MEKSINIPLKLIAATCEGNGIGIDNDLPWRLKQEMAYFTRMTTTTVDDRPQKKARRNDYSSADFNDGDCQVRWFFGLLKLKDCCQ